MAPVQPEQLSQLVEFIREQRRDLTLEDVMVLAERMAQSLDHSMARVDELLHDEFQAIIGEIGGLRRDISNLKPDLVRYDKIPQAGQELDAVVEATEAATCAIMEAAEEIMAADASDPVAYKALVDDKMIVVFEACSFQDITGQRIAKVVRTLGWIEERLNTLSKTLKLDDYKAPPHEETPEERRERELMLHGPQMKGDAIDQTKVDDLLSTSDQSAIDALFD
jgi:chemotaxis protein CheZ